MKNMILVGYCKSHHHPIFQTFLLFVYGIWLVTLKMQNSACEPDFFLRNCLFSPEEQGQNHLIMKSVTPALILKLDCEISIILVLVPLLKCSLNLLFPSLESFFILPCTQWCCICSCMCLFGSDQISKMEISIFQFSYNNNSLCNFKSTL